MRHNLPSGGWVELRDVNTLRGKDSKRVTRALRDLDSDQPMNVQALEAGLSMVDGVIALMVTAWELPYDTEDGRPWQLPVEDIGLIDELSATDHRVMCALVEPAVKILAPGKPDPGQYEDPTSPTEPASA